LNLIRFLSFRVTLCFWVRLVVMKSVVWFCTDEIEVVV